MSRGTTKNINRSELVDALAARPRTVAELAKDLGFRPDSVRRRLSALASGRFVMESPMERGAWQLGGRAGYVLAGAVGSSRINAGVFDAYTRAVAGSATRRSKLRRSDGPEPGVKAIVERTADIMAETLDLAGDQVRAEVRAITLALPFGMDAETGQLLSDEPEENARELLHAALRERELGLDLDRMEWLWASDVAFEGVFEHYFRPASQAGRSPLMIVKLSRNVRLALVLDGVPWHGIAGDVADLGELTTWAERPDGVIEPIKLREAVSLDRLYEEMTGRSGLSVLDEEERTSTDTDIFNERFKPLLQQRGEAGTTARAAMNRAGEMIGRCLDGPIAACGPAMVIITGFLSRDEQQLRDGLLSVCGHHRVAGTAIEISSGIEAELRGVVVDTENLDASLAAPLEPQQLPHQYRVAAGSAKLVFEQRLRPQLQANVAARDRAASPAER
ncbi:MAG: hypothetical protein JWQ18_403 [Conexibacter sp.]|nr:hypothetical protein [Conexibacter sp.]